MFSSTHGPAMLYYYHILLYNSNKYSVRKFRRV